MFCLNPSDFFGQNNSLLLLESWLKHDHVPTSVLFSGPSMIGKTTLAMIYARRLLCKKTDLNYKLDSCGECYPCKAIINGCFSDFAFVLPRTKEITVDTIREDYDNFSSALYFPSNSSKRVILIDSAHLLNEQSGNMMLKLFEEAPDATVFILVTDHPYDVLPTIRSRCEEIKLSEEPVEKIESSLFNNNVDYTRAKKIAELSQGKWVLANILFKDQKMLELLEKLVLLFESLIANNSENSFEATFASASQRLSEHLTDREREIIKWTTPDQSLLDVKSKKSEERFEITLARKNELERNAYRMLFETLKNSMVSIVKKNSGFAKYIKPLAQVIETADLWLMQNVPDTYILGYIREVTRSAQFLLPNR